MTKEQSSTSTQEVPKVKLALQEKYEEQDKKENKKQEDLSNKESSKLPKPTGWRLLVLPLCKKGDWVVFARYAGSRIQIDGGEVRLLNDDEILATIENPEDIFHQY
jgi:hypothetical protein